MSASKYDHMQLGAQLDVPQCNINEALLRKTLGDNADLIRIATKYTHTHTHTVHILYTD